MCHTLYKQCKIVNKIDGAVHQETVWLPEIFANAGETITINNQTCQWEIEVVYNSPALEIDAINEKAYMYHRDNQKVWVKHKNIVAAISQQ